MGKKIYAKVGRNVLPLSDWARLLGISRQRVCQLYNAGRLEDYVNGNRRKAGRPADEKMLKVIRSTMNQSAKEVAEMLGCSVSSIYKYRRKINGAKTEKH